MGPTDREPRESLGPGQARTARGSAAREAGVDGLAVCRLVASMQGLLGPWELAVSASAQRSPGRRWGPHSAQARRARSWGSAAFPPTICDLTRWLTAGAQEGCMGGRLVAEAHRQQDEQVPAQGVLAGGARAAGRRRPQVSGTQRKPCRKSPGRVALLGWPATPVWVKLSAENEGEFVGCSSVTLLVKGRWIELEGR